MSSEPAPAASPRQYSVLFVCLGNICRSPMAEAVFLSHSLFRKPTPHPLIDAVDSAGTAAYHSGSSPDPRTLSVIAEHNLLDGQYVHYARQVCEEDFERFDYIMGMDRENVRNLNFVKRRLEHRREVWLKDQELEKRQREEGEKGSTLRQLRRRASQLSNHEEFADSVPATSSSQYLHPDSAIADPEEIPEPEPELEPIAPYMGPLAEVYLFGDFGGASSRSKSKMKFKKSGQLVEEMGEEVDDPYYGGKKGFQIAYDQLERFTKAFLAMLEEKEATREKDEGQKL